MRHRAVLLPLTCLLALATGLTLLLLAQLFAAGPLPGDANTAEAAANTDLVRAFYAAANAALQTGDVARLDQFVAPDFVEHAPPVGAGTDRVGLIQAVIALHAGFPQARLVVDDLRAQADEVVARVRVTDADSGSFLGFAIPASLAVWSPIDVFRVADHLIAEHWGSGQPPATFQPLAAGTLTLPFDRRTIAAKRLTFVPDDTYEGETYLGPKALYVDAGQLTVTVQPTMGGPALVTYATRAGHASTQGSVAPGASITLATGDLITFPQGGSFSAYDPGKTATVCLEVGPQSSAPFTGEGQRGPTRQELAANLPGPLPRGLATVALGRVTLAPGASLHLAGAAGPELVAVEAGALDLGLASGSAWVERRADNSSTLLGEQPAPPSSQDQNAFGYDPAMPELSAAGNRPAKVATPATPAPLPMSATLAAGDSALVEPAAAATIANPGAAPVTVLVVGFTPTSPAPSSDHQ